MISVVIPVLNEAPRLPALLAALTSEPVAAEVIVADGGSRDGSAAVARACGADFVLETQRGRGAQLAAGAARATGGIVLFLHADSLLPPGALVAVQRLMEARPDLVGGNFRLLFDGEDATSRWVERFYAGIRRLGVFYGDSGIFVRRDVLQAIGGVRPLPLMEDWDLVRRMRAAGRVGCVADPPRRGNAGAEGGVRRLMRVAELMTREVEFIAPDAPVSAAAELMGELEVGALPVGGPQDPRGVVTDRDLLYRVVARGLDASKVQVGEVFSAPLVACREDDGVQAALDQMAANHLRRLAVLDAGGRMTGWITLADIARALLLESGTLQSALAELTRAEEAQPR